MPAGALHKDTPLACRFDQIQLIAPSWQSQVQVKACGHPRRNRIRQRRGDRSQCGVASAPIDRPHPTEMPREPARFDEPRQGQLLEHGISHVVQQLLPDDLLDEPVRCRQPTESQCGREGLACASGVDHPLRCEALQSADRRAVVPKFGVVIILDDQSVVVVGPFDERGAPCRAEDRSRRIGMCWRHKHRSDVCAPTALTRRGPHRQPESAPLLIPHWTRLLGEIRSTGPRRRPRRCPETAVTGPPGPPPASTPT